MGRKRQEKEQAPEETAQEDGRRRSRRGRKLAVLLALAGVATWLVRRNQRKAEIDEGIWHEAPAPTAPASAAPTS